MQKWVYVPGGATKTEIIKALLVRVMDELSITDEKTAKDLLYDAIGANEENIIAYLKEAVGR